MRNLIHIPCTCWFDQKTSIFNLTTTWVYEQNQIYDQRFYFENDENHFCRTPAITDTCKIDK